jgi:hypothetical protein
VAEWTIGEIIKKNRMLTEEKKEKIERIKPKCVNITTINFYYNQAILASSFGDVCN